MAQRHAREPASEQIEIAISYHVKADLTLLVAVSTLLSLQHQRTLYQEKG